MAIAYEATGSGAIDSTSPFSLSWTHNSAGGANTVVIIGLMFLGSGPMSMNSSTRSVTYGSTPASFLGYSALQGGGFTALYAVWNPASGSQTITATASSSTGGPLMFKGGSISYTGVGAIGEVNGTDGTGPTVTQTAVSASGRRLVHVAGSASTIASYSQTARYTEATTYAFVMGDAVGAASVTFSYTTGSGVIWGSSIVELFPATDSGSTRFASIGESALVAGSSASLAASFTHAIAKSDTHTLLVVAVALSVSTNSTSTTCAVTCGGVAMTQQSLTLIGASTTRGAIGIYTLANPGTGSKTIAVTSGGTSTKVQVAAQSVVYENVDTANISAVASAAALALSVTSAANRRAFYAGTNGAAITVPTQNERYLNGASPAGVADYLLVQDAPGAATVSFNATGTATTPQSLGISLPPFNTSPPSVGTDYVVLKGGYESEISFGSKSDGAMVSKTDTGQSTILTYNPDTTALPSISGGYYVISTTAAIAAAGYLSWGLTGGEVTYMEGMFKRTTTGSTNGDAITLIASATALNSGLIGAAPDAPMHVNFLYDHVEYGYISGGSLTVVAAFTYPGGPITDTNLHKVSVRRDKANNIIYVTCPDGSTTTFSDTHIGSIAANYPWFEIIYGNASTDHRNSFGWIAATSAANGARDEAVAITDSIVAGFLLTSSSTDAVGITDSITLQVGRTTTDAVGATDSVALDQTRSATDPVGVTDFLGLDQPRTFTDAVGLVDSVSVGPQRTITDPVGVTDTVSLDQTRSATDPVGVTDSLGLDQPRTFTDAVGIVDSVGLDQPRTATDAVGLTDSISLGPAKTSTDAIGLTDAVSLDQSRTGTDAVGVTDAITVTTDFATTATDAEAITDAMTTVADYVRTSTDIMGLSDSITPSLGFNPTATDAVGVTDALTARIDVVLTSTEAIGISDGVGIDDGETLTDQVGVADSVATAFDGQRSGTDAVGVTDSVTAAQGFAPTGTDAIGLTDSIQLDRYAAATDVVGVTDALAPDQGFSRDLTDTVGVSDSMATARETLAGDVVGVTDQFVLDQGVGLLDAMGLSDAAQAAQDFVRSGTDAMGLTDTAQVTFGSVSGDMVGVTDAIATIAAADRAAADAVDLGDNGSFTLQAAGTIAGGDLVDLTDHVVVVRDAVLSLTDVVGLSDGLATAVDSPRSATDSVSISDTLAAARAAVVSPTDPVGVVDAGSFAFGGTAAASEAVGVTDSASFTIGSVVTATDSIGVTDDLSSSVGGVVAATDPVGVSDSVTITLSRTASDPLGIADALSVGLSRAYVEAVGLTDTAVFDLSVGIRSTDPVAIGEGAEFVADLERAWSDPVGIADSAAFDVFDIVTPPPLSRTVTVQTEDRVRTRAGEERVTAASTESRVRHVAGEPRFSSVRAEDRIAAVQATVDP